MRVKDSVDMLKGVGRVCSFFGSESVAMAERVELRGERPLMVQVFGVRCIPCCEPVMDWRVLSGTSKSKIINPEVGSSHVT